MASRRGSGEASDGREPRLPRAPGRAVISTAYILSLWISKEMANGGAGAVCFDLERIGQYPSYLRFTAWLYDFTMKELGVSRGETGYLETEQWEKVRASTTRTLPNFELYHSLAPGVYAKYLEAHPTQAQLAVPDELARAIAEGMAEEASAAPPPSSLQPEPTTFKAPAPTPVTKPEAPKPTLHIAATSPQKAPCGKCSKTPTWRVSVPGERWLVAWCADHLKEAGLEVPKEDGS